MKRFITFIICLTLAAGLYAQEQLEFSRTFLMPGKSAEELYENAKVWTNSVQWQAPFGHETFGDGENRYSRKVLARIDDGVRDILWLLSGYDDVTLYCNIDCYEGRYVVRFSKITSYTGILYGSNGILNPEQFNKPRVYRRMSKVVDNVVIFFDNVCEDISRVMEAPPVEYITI